MLGVKQWWTRQISSSKSLLQRPCDEARPRMCRGSVCSHTVASRMGLGLGMEVCQGLRWGKEETEAGHALRRWDLALGNGLW